MSCALIAPRMASRFFVEKKMSSIADSRSVSAIVKVGRARFA